jgi:hypothetical protein
MTKARDLADLGNKTSLDEINDAYNAGALSNRNLIINGAMQVAQRGTSVSSQTATGYKTVDRFYTNASGATYNQSQQTVTVGGETGLPLQFSKFLRHQVTTGNNWSQIYQKIEDVTSVPTGTVTLSFYAKGTSPNAGLSFIAWQNFGSGGSSEVTVTISPTVTLTSTWQRFTVNITVPSVTGKTIGTGSHFYFGIGQGGSTSTDAWTLDITGVQLEVGDTATPFEHRSYLEELEKCKRYYSNYTATTAQSHMMFPYVGFATSSTDTEMTGHHPVEMRVSPTVSFNGGTNFRIGHDNTDQDTTSMSADFISKTGMRLRATAGSGLVDKEGVFLLNKSTTLAIINFDAEL